MPISIPYTFTQTPTTLTLTFTIPSLPSSPPLNSSTLSLLSSPLLLQLSFPPALSQVDLLHPITPALTTHTLHPPSRVTVHCHKATPSIWPSLIWQGPPPALRERRAQSLQQWEEGEKERRERGKEDRRRERKDDRDREGERGKREKEALLTLKNRERVVALSDLTQWQEAVKATPSPPIWQASSGETIEVLEPERKEEVKEAPLEVRAPVRELPPVRSAVRLTTTFTPVHPTLPSLPARDSSPPAAVSLVPASPLLPSLLSLKGRGDAFYRYRHLPSALSAYGAVLDEARGQVMEGEVGWCVGRVWCNRSAVHWAMRGRGGGEGYLRHVRAAERDGGEGLRILKGVAGEFEGEKAKVEEKTHKRLAQVYAALGQWGDAIAHLPPSSSGISSDSPTEASLVLFTSHLQAVERGEDVAAFKEAAVRMEMSPPHPLTALREVTRGLILSPLSLDGLTCAAQAHLELEQWEEARKAADLALAVQTPTSAASVRSQLLGMRGEALLQGAQLGKLSSALADIDLALTSHGGAAGDERLMRLKHLIQFRIEVDEVGMAVRSWAASDKANSGWDEVRAVVREGLKRGGASPLSHGTRVDDRDEWMLGMVGMGLELAGCDMREGRWREGGEGVERAQDRWRQWVEGRGVVGSDGGEGEGEEERGRRERGVVREERRVERERRWWVLALVKRATCLCYEGRVKEGREGYVQALQWVEGKEREEVEEDIQRIDNQLLVTC